MAARAVEGVELAPCPAQLLGGKASWSWQNSIPATPAERLSITFRTLERGG